VTRPAAWAALIAACASTAAVALLLNARREPPTRRKRMVGLVVLALACVWLGCAVALFGRDG
jgi:drug/metabolite transporter (DMT)-like permease